jgi:hypothetical protein
MYIVITSRPCRAIVCYSFTDNTTNILLPYMDPPQLNIPKGINIPKDINPDIKGG